MKYPEKLNLRIPLKKKEYKKVLNIINTFNGKKIKLARDPNKPRAGVSYIIITTNVYDDLFEINLRRI